MTLYRAGARVFGANAVFRPAIFCPTHRTLTEEAYAKGQKVSLNGFPSPSIEEADVHARQGGEGPAEWLKQEAPLIPVSGALSCKDSLVTLYREPVKCRK